MLLHQIVSRVQNLTEDPDYWVKSRIATFVNQAKDSISSYFGLLANGYILMGSVVGQRSYSLPLDFVALDMASWGNGNCLTPANRVSSPRDASQYLAYTDTPGMPERYFLWGREDHTEIWVLPTFNSVVEIELFYWRRIPDVVNDNDEVMIPRDLHDKIVEYCRRQTWVEDELHNYNPSVFDAWWEMELVKMQISKNVQLAGSDNIGPGNFDDRMPRVSDDGVGFTYRIVGVSDGTIW